MIYTSCEDFFEKASHVSRLSREEEKTCATLMKDGDSEARQRIINGYIPYVASFVKRTARSMQKLELVYRCLSALEKQVDRFDFLSEGESFLHRLGIALRSELTRYIADN